MRTGWIALAAALIALVLLVVMVVPSPRSSPAAPHAGRPGCGLLGGCDMDLPALPSCDCYLNADCVGRIDYDDLNPHARGHFHYPQAIAMDYRRGTRTLEYAHIEPLNDSVRQLLATARRALADYIRHADRETFLRTVLGLRAASPAYPGFGRCEFPHPPAHDHAFIYEDAADCVARELLAMLEPLSSAVQRDRH